MKRALAVISFCLFGSFAFAQVEYIKETTPVPPHPRLLFVKADEANVKNAIATDPTWEAMHKAILAECDKIITLEPIKRIQIGRRLLDKSRECLRRVLYLSYAWRMTGEKKYFDRTEKELLTVAAFSDWNPSHFLDVAEMTLSLAIGYDWLYNDLSIASRKAIREGITKNGLNASMDEKNNGWLKVTNNWNQVCNTGMAYGAMAVYESDPVFARSIINRAITSIALPMKEYGPNGAYVEGYSYWGYGTGFNTLFISMLEKAFGNDFGLSSTPGFLQTADFMVNMMGPSHKPFNYFDAGTDEEIKVGMFWFALKRKDPSLLWDEQRHIRPAESEVNIHERLLPVTLIWGAGMKMDHLKPPVNTIWVGQGKNPVALLRSSWKEDALFVGIKGGTPLLSHSHMDAGSFVMDAMGVRWGFDFGMQDYESLESKKVDLWNMKQNSQRWEVFRYNNLAHNTLTVNGQLQTVEGNARIIHTSGNPAFINAVVEMKDLYKTTLTKATRGIAIVNNSYVLVRDEIETALIPDTIRWNMLTDAQVTVIDGHTAELSKDGKKLTLQLLSPANGVVKTWSAMPTHDYDAPNPGKSFVGFEIKVAPGTKAAINVVLKPGSGAIKPVSVKTIAEWP